MINIVSQPYGSYLCAACAAAMLADVDLDYVLATAIFSVDAQTGKFQLSRRELTRFLLDHDLVMGASNVFVCPYPENMTKLMRSGVYLDLCANLREDLRKLPGYLCVKSQRISGGQHAVVWCPDRKAILDPHFGEAQEFEKYEVYEWLPVYNLIST